MVFHSVVCCWKYINFVAIVLYVNFIFTLLLFAFFFFGLVIIDKHILSV